VYKITVNVLDLEKKRRCALVYKRSEEEQARMIEA